MWESRLYYLSGQRDFNRHRYQLCQEAAIEGHHEHHWVIVWKNKCDLQMRCETCVTVHLLQVRSMVCKRQAYNLKHQAYNLKNNFCLSHNEVVIYENRKVSHER